VPSLFLHRVGALLLFAACDRATPAEPAAIPSAAAEPAPPETVTSIAPAALPSTVPAPAPSAAPPSAAPSLAAVRGDDPPARADGRSAAIVTVARRYGPKQGIGCGFVHFVRAFEVVLESHTGGPGLPERFVVVVSCAGGGIERGDRLEIDVSTERSPSQPDPAGNASIPKALPRRYGTVRRA
jgi:hypothetical protein